MQIVLSIISVALLGLVIYFAVSPKSSRLLKLAALIALGLITLSIGVCAVFLIKGPAEQEPSIPFTVIAEAAQPARKSNGPAIVVFSVIFLFILGMIFFIAFRRQKKNDPERKKAGGVPAGFDIPNMEAPAGDRQGRDSLRE